MNKGQTAAVASVEKKSKVLIHVMKAYRGVKVELHSFLSTVLVLPQKEQIINKHMQEPNVSFYGNS
jgi:hypothetical protein